MKSHDELQNTRTLYNTYREATEPSSTKEETARAVNILDAKYEKADLPTLVETVTFLEVQICGYVTDTLHRGIEITYVL
eukprot:scaffold18882_cov119-Skeletonema_marinoi.AAC.2